MQVNIITLPFDPGDQSFDFDTLNRFCLNKEVIQLQAAFFDFEGRPYWSFTIIYKPVLAEGEKQPGKLMAQLSKKEKLLFERLRTWRAEKAHQLGHSPFVIANNRQLVDMIKQKIQTKADLQTIKGFGSKKTANHGQEILDIIQTFYEHE